MSVWHGGTILKAITAATQAYEQQSTTLNMSPTPQQTQHKNMLFRMVLKKEKGPIGLALITVAEENWKAVEMVTL